MKGILAGLLLGLTLLACTTDGQHTVDAALNAYRIKECQAFEAARDKVRRVKQSLSDEDLEQSIELNKLSVILCTLSIGELTDQMTAIAERGS